MEKPINWLPPAVLAAFGIAFLFSSLQLEADSSGGIGARSLPLSMCVLFLALLAVETYFELRKGLRKDQGAGPDANAEGEAEDDPRSIYPRVFALYALPSFGLVFVYGYFHGWFGYFLSTFLASLAIFALFRNGLKDVLIHSVIGTVVFYFVFINLLNVYDPPGTLIDLSDLLN